MGIQGQPQPRVHHLGTDKKQNQRILQEAGYVFGDVLISQILQGEYVRTEAVGEANAQFITTQRKVDTHSHGVYLMHSVDELKKAIGLRVLHV